MAENEVVIHVRADDKASGTIGGLAGQIKSFAAGIPAPIAVAGTALAGLGAVAFKTANDFRAAQNFLLDSATGEEFAEQWASVKRVLGTVPQDVRQVAMAFDAVNDRLGLTGPAAETLTRKMLDLSRVLGTDINTTIENTTRLFGDWGVESSEQSRVLDQLALAATTTGVDLRRLAERVVFFGAPLRQFGFSLEEAIAVFAKFEREGVNTETVMAGLRIGLARAAAEGKDAPKAFREVVKAIKEAGTASEGTALAVEFFGARAGPDMAAAIREGRFEIDELVSRLRTADGALEEAAERTLTLGQRFSIMRNTVMTELEPALMGLMGLLERGAEWLGAHLPRAIEATKAQMKAWEPRLLAVKDLLEKDVIPAIREVVETFETRWPQIQPVVEAVMTIIEALVIGRLRVTADAVRLVMAVLRGDWSAAWSAIRDIVRDSLDVVRGVVVGSLDLLNALTGGKLFQLLGLFVGWFGGLRSFFTGTVAPFLSGIVSWFWAAGAFAANAFTGTFSALKDGVRAVLNFIVDRLNAFASGLNAIAGAFNRVAGLIPGAPKLPTIPAIPRLHTGGVVPGTPGQEVLTVLEAGERVIPRGAPAPAAAPAITVNLNVLGSVVTERDLVQLIRDEILRGGLRDVLAVPA